jgi:predicted MPP superfamily phosphohydrolase
MKLTWITDVHLNFLEKDERIDFYHTLIATDNDGVMISGDMAEAASIEPILKEMANATQKPIYFVLGNHDYYRGGYK